MPFPHHAAPFLNTGQQTVTAGSVVFIAGNSQRRRIAIMCDTLCFIGDNRTTLTTANGFKLTPNISPLWLEDYVGPLYVIGTAGLVSWIEESG